MSSLHTNWPKHLVGLSVLFLLASCGDGEGKGTAEFSHPIEDQTLACGEGEVGWVFPDSEQRKDTEQYLSQAGDDAVTQRKPRLDIDVQNIGCSDGTQSSYYSASAEACEGRQSCSIILLSGVGCTSVTASYTCGPWDIQEGGQPKVYESTRAVPSEPGQTGIMELNCDRAEDVQDRLAGETTCIPEQCHGRTRRNLEMECVPDDSKVETAPEVRLLGAPEPKYAPQTERNLYLDVEGDQSNHWLYPNMPYTFTVEVDFHAALVPDRSSVAIWMQDSFMGDPGTILAFHPKFIFRCMAAKVDILASDDHVRLDNGRVRYTKTVTKVLSNGCFEDKVLFENGARSVRATDASATNYTWENFRDDFAHSGTSLSLAYDMEGRTVFHKDAADLSMEELAGHEPECTPNPPDMFYDARSETYDLVGYYSQRSIGESLSVKIAPPEMKRRMELGTLDIKPRGDHFKIRADGGYTPPLPIDITWYAANLRDASPFNPFPSDKQPAKGWHTNSTTDNWAPPELRADVYIMPVYDRNAAYGTENYTYTTSAIRNKVASLPLRDGLPEGKTDTVMLQADDRLRATIIERNPDYPNMYVESSNDFYVYYCIRSSVPQTKSGRGFYWALYPDRRNATEDLEYANGDPITNFVVEGGVTESDTEGTLDALALESESHTPALTEDGEPMWGQSWRGCRLADTTIRIEVDRYVSAVEATFEQAPGEISSRKASGDGQMTSESDNDREVICDDPQKLSCVETSVSGSRSDGTSSSQSAFRLKMDFKRGKKGTTVSTSLAGELLGFQLIDPTDPETEEKDATDQVSVEIGPDWEQIADGLNNGRNPQSPWEWTDGSFGGVSGLGIAWSRTMRSQIGPVPVQATLTFSVGTGVSLEFTVSYTPTVNSQYPCIGESRSCITVNEDRKTFVDAAQSCASQGGRLAELSSSREASQLFGALQNESGQYWIGGQLAYRYPKTECIDAYNQAACSGEGLRAQARWLSNSEAFAQVEQLGLMSFNDEFHGNDRSILMPAYPDFRSVYVDASSRLASADRIDATKPYVCRFDPVAETSSVDWQTKVNLGAGVGLTLSGCSPTDDPGLCVELSVNLIGAKISAVFENGYHWMIPIAGEAPTKRSGYVKFSVPWELKLLNGSVRAVLRLLFWEESWQIYAWDGLIDEGGTLFEITAPVVEDL